jgi:hypothetical protein
MRAGRHIASALAPLALALAATILAGSLWPASAHAVAPLASFAGVPPVAAGSTPVGGGVTVKLGGDVIVRQGDKADSVVVVGGDVIVYGVVAHTVVAIGGDVRLMSTAVVGSTVKPDDTSIVVIGGQVSAEPGAVVIGKTVRVSGNWFGAVPGRRILRSLTHPFRVHSVLGWVAQTLVLVLAALVAAAVAPRQVRSIRDQVRRRPLPALGWGALMMLAIAVASIILVLTIIGLLLLVPVWLLVLPITGLFCFTGVAARLGGLLLARDGTTGDNLMLSAVLGMLLLNIVRFVPVAGFVVFIALGVVGVGAGLLAWNDWRRAGGPTPIAAPAPPSAESAAHKDPGP